MKIKIFTELLNAVFKSLINPEDLWVWDGAGRVWVQSGSVRDDP